MHHLRPGWPPTLALIIWILFVLTFLVPFVGGNAPTHATSLAILLKKAPGIWQHIEKAGVLTGITASILENGTPESPHPMGWNDDTVEAVNAFLSSMSPNWDAAKINGLLKKNKVVSTALSGVCSSHWTKLWRIPQLFEAAFEARGGHPDKFIQLGIPHDEIKLTSASVNRAGVITDMAAKLLGRAGFADATMTVILPWVDAWLSGIVIGVFRALLNRVKVRSKKADELKAELKAETDSTCLVQS
jgi:hypothetical protein